MTDVTQDHQTYTVADAVGEMTRIQAVKQIVSDREKDVRGWLAGQADTVEEQTGGGFNVPVQGLGRVYRTQPDVRLEVDDWDRLVEWAEEHAITVGWVQELDTAALTYDLRSFTDLTCVDLSGYVRDKPVFPEKMWDEWKAYPREDGRVFDPSSGEQLPLRAVPKSAPTLTVKTEAVAVKAARRQLEERLTRQLEAGGR